VSRNTILAPTTTASENSAHREFGDDGTLVARQSHRGNQGRPGGSEAIRQRLNAFRSRQRSSSRRSKRIATRLLRGARATASNIQIYRQQSSSVREVALLSEF